MIKRSMRKLLTVLSVGTVGIVLSGCATMPAFNDIPGQGGVTSLDGVPSSITFSPEALPPLPSIISDTPAAPSPVAPPPTGSALEALQQIPVKGRAPKTGYTREQFGEAWTDNNTTTWGNNALRTREDILSRDLTNVTCKVRGAAPRTPPCNVESGHLVDPYTGQEIDFVRGRDSSQLIPIDHVVPLSDAWQKGAQQLSMEERTNLANDPLNLIATTREMNSGKGDSDAATWIMPNVAFRCPYIARQVAVKIKYHLWVTEPEKQAMEGILQGCPAEPLPSEQVYLSRTLPN